MTMPPAILSGLRYALRSPAVRHALWALLATALAGAVIALGWWGPARREQAQLQAQLDARRVALVQAQQQQQAMRAQQDVLPRLAALESKLRAQTSQAELIQGIAALAARRGVRVVSQSFEEGRPQPGQAQPLYLDLGLVGDYVALRHWMADLATLPPWLEILEERLEPAAQGGSLVRAQLRLLTYRRGREQP